MPFTLDTKTVTYGCISLSEYMANVYPPQEIVSFMRVDLSVQHGFPTPGIDPRTIQKLKNEWLSESMTKDFGILESCISVAKSLKFCLTSFNPRDCNLPGSSAHGILQARILEWVSMPSSRGSS